MFCMRGRMWWITFASSQRKGSELGEFLAALQLVEAAKLDRTSVMEMHVTNTRTIHVTSCYIVLQCC